MSRYTPVRWYDMMWEGLSVNAGRANSRPTLGSTLQDVIQKLSNVVNTGVEPFKT